MGSKRLLNNSISLSKLYLILDIFDIIIFNISKLYHLFMRWSNKKMDHPDKDAKLTYFQSKLKALLF